MLGTRSVHPHLPTDHSRYFPRIYEKIFDHKPSQPILTVVQIVACYSQVTFSLFQVTLACFDVTVGVVCNTNFDCCMAKKPNNVTSEKLLKIPRINIYNSRVALRNGEKRQIAQNINDYIMFLLLEADKDHVIVT